jgi:PTS system mannitol-specific IIB component
MTTIQPGTVKKLVVACDAGMGSSVMLAGTLKKQLASTGIVVEHTPVAGIPADADLVLTHTGLADRARGVVGDTPVVPFNLFLGDPAVTRIVAALTKGEAIDV